MRWWSTALAAVLVAALALAGPADARAGWSPTVPYISPIDPMRAVELARLPAQPWLPGHRGVDLEADPGMPVRSPAAGVVIVARVIVDRGVVTVQHDDGGLTSLEPVDAAASPGDRVVAGDVVGTVADTTGHCAPQACLHWGVRVDGDYIDPLDTLAGYGRVRLLPRAEGSFRRRRQFA